MSKSHKTTKVAARDAFEARRNGQYVRSKSWSPNGERKDPKRDRRNAKLECREHNS